MRATLSISHIHRHSTRSPKGCGQPFAHMVPPLGCLPMAIWGTLKSGITRSAQDVSLRKARDSSKKPSTLVPSSTEIGKTSPHIAKTSRAHSICSVCCLTGMYTVMKNTCTPCCDKQPRKGSNAHVSTRFLMGEMCPIVQPLNTSTSSKPYLLRSTLKKASITSSPLVGAGC